MTDSSSTWSRRAVLRGAGALVALPFLEQTARAAQTSSSATDGGDAKPPRRMGIFTVTGGTVWESWKPEKEGKLEKLPSILRPLESVKDQILVLTGLANSGQSEGLNGHEHCALVHLTAAEMVRKIDGRLHAAVSVDQAVAAHLGDKTLLPSLEFGLQSHETKYSFRSADAPIPYESNPRLVFERLFRGRQPIVPNWKNRTGQAAAKATQESTRSDSLERSLLDLVREDAGDLRRKLGRADQRRLEDYLTALRSVEKRIAFLEERQRMELLDSANPGPSKASVPAAAQNNVWADTRPIYADPERHADYIRVVSDLFVLAFQTDATRVQTVAIGSDEAHFPGVVTVGYERHCHTLEHQGNSFRPEDADPIAREACRQMHAWYTSLFGELVRKMAAIDEGGSSLLDNSMLLYTSYMADGGHGLKNYPALLAGKCGGSLNPGRHLAYAPGTPVANLYIEMMDRMGLSVKQFGDSRTAKGAAFDGRLPGLV